MAAQLRTQTSQIIDDVPATTPQREQRAADPLVVQCAGLVKIFKDFWLRSRVIAVGGKTPGSGEVQGIDLAINRGEVFGLLGPNGSGKSTTIKMILGLLHPTQGRIAVFGKRPDDVATKKLIGYLPEETYLYKFLNARETLDYYGRLFHLPRATRRQRIDMLLDMVGLTEVQHRPVNEYSKGMQRRIGLAQALINDPQLLVLDEPTTGLDPLGTRQIKDLIASLAQRGKTVILCSHLLADVEDICDRVAIMFGGRVRAMGTVDELLTRHDETVITTPALDSETVEKIDEMLEARGIHISRVDQPRQKLEALFLDIVEQARREGADTSGARSGGDIAGFLREGDETSEQVEGEAVIEQLVTRTEPTPAETATTESTPPTDAAADQPEDPTETDVLEQLVAPSATQEQEEDTAAVAATPSPHSAEPTEADTSVIDQLVAPPDVDTRPVESETAQEPTADTPATEEAANVDAVEQQTAEEVTGEPEPDAASEPEAEVAEEPSEDEPAEPGAEPTAIDRLLSTDVEDQTPDKSTVFEQPPTEDEQSMIEKLVEDNWGAREQPKDEADATDAPEAERDADTPAAEAQTTEGQHGKGEKPFTGFLDAIEDVPEDAPEVVDDEDDDSPAKPR